MLAASAAYAVATFLALLGPGLKLAPWVLDLARTTHVGSLRWGQQRFVYTAFGGNGSSGVDWVRWLVAIVIAAVLGVVASTVTGRNTTARR
ncbi:hypothetical protein [Kribbella sp. NPDC000426]|uniref:hypothetical protein n=1 Tax=Kribbella sp. NPDC000426 TaxID=3154255 RepID=UPI003330A447